MNNLPSSWKKKCAKDALVESLQLNNLPFHKVVTAPVIYLLASNLHVLQKILIFCFEDKVSQTGDCFVQKEITRTKLGNPLVPTELAFVVCTTTTNLWNPSIIAVMVLKDQSMYFYNAHFWKTLFLKTLHVGCDGKPLGNFLGAPAGGGCMHLMKSFRSVVEACLSGELPMPATCHIQWQCALLVFATVLPECPWLSHDQIHWLLSAWA